MTGTVKARVEQSKGQTKNIRRTAIRIADLTSGAYSVFAYRSWYGVALALLQAGFSPIEAAAIMRSKWTRWASDEVNGKATGQDLLRWMRGSFPSIAGLGREVEELAQRTYPLAEGNDLAALEREEVQ